jgi:glycosyltransferase involved in cell wall biosynthesis
MNIIFLTQVLPYPPDAGPKFKTLQVLRYLTSRGHSITLISLVRPDELKYIETIRKQVTEFYPIQITRSRLMDIYFLIRSFLTGRSFLVDRDAQRELISLLRLLVDEDIYDFIHADQVTMTQFALPFVSQNVWQRNKPQLVFDAHNATWKILDRFVADSSLIKRMFFKLEARRVRRYEAEIVSKFDHILTVSEIDQQGLIEAAVHSGVDIEQVKHKFMVIPITVDTNEILPVKRSDSSLNIFTMGTLHYPPNADGIRWFINDVFPLVQKQVVGVTLTIVGKNPPSDFIVRQKEEPDIYTVPGYVPDLTPWFEKAAMVIVPVRIGGGMRVRILEAFARGMPVVTTTVGLEGIDAIPGKHVLVEDDPEKFADAVVQLIHDQELRTKLSNNARQLVEQVYDQQIILRKLDQVYPLCEQYQ